ncbi:unnamed protein product [Amoebophrya sp. A25]|nr:unnamed protein product [Amoebophrya sp. A25]|eukprot:GSA25T00026842001.1
MEHSRPRNIFRIGVTSNFDFDSRVDSRFDSRVDSRVDSRFGSTVDSRFDSRSDSDFDSRLDSDFDSRFDSREGSAIMHDLLPLISEGSEEEEGEDEFDSSEFDSSEIDSSELASSEVDFSQDRTWEAQFCEDSVAILQGLSAGVQDVVVPVVANGTTTTSQTRSRTTPAALTTLHYTPAHSNGANRTMTSGTTSNGAKIDAPRSPDEAVVSRNATSNSEIPVRTQVVDGLGGNHNYHFFYREPPESGEHAEEDELQQGMNLSSYSDSCTDDSGDDDLRSVELEFLRRTKRRRKENIGGSGSNRCRHGDRRWDGEGEPSSARRFDEDDGSTSQSANGQQGNAGTGEPFGEPPSAEKKDNDGEL